MALAGALAFASVGVSCSDDPPLRPELAAGGAGGAGGAGATGGIGNIWPDDVGSEPILLLGFGDSVTDGFCASSGRSYIDMLASNPPEHADYVGRDLISHYPGLRVANEAVSGSTTCSFDAGTLGEQLSRLDLTELKASVVVITLGGNDLIHDYSCVDPRDCSAYCSTLSQASVWVKAYKQRMLSFIETFERKLPNPQIFLATIYDPTDGVGDIENAPVTLPPWPDGLEIIALYNKTIVDIAEADPNVHLVDMHAQMLGHGIHYDDKNNPHHDASDPSYWYCSNLEDPNDQGYHAIREAFWAVIAKRLKIE